MPPVMSRMPDAARKPPTTGYGMKRSHWPRRSAPTPYSRIPVSSVLTERDEHVDDDLIGARALGGKRGRDRGGKRSSPPPPASRGRR